MTKDKQKKDPFDDFWSRKRPNGGASWADWNPPPEPERKYIPKDEWPIPKERTDRVFAKCCTPENRGSTHAGSDSMPASDFGKVIEQVREHLLNCTMLFISQWRRAL
ncbi:hypothetical protein ACYZT9_21930 [Pseudomonas sp. ZT5P21]